MYPNRTLCDVLGEMRKCFETRNFSYLMGLISEAQSMANRMEAALEDKHDMERNTRERGVLHKKIKRLRKLRDKLSEKHDGGADTEEDY